MLRVTTFKQRLGDLLDPVWLHPPEIKSTGEGLAIKDDIVAAEFAPRKSVVPTKDTFASSFLKL